MQAKFTIYIFIVVQYALAKNEITETVILNV
jgi:hypothetical protein